MVLPGLLLWFTLLPSGLEQLLVQTVLGYQSVLEAFGRIFSSSCPSPRYSHLEIWTLPSPSYLSVLRCLGVASGVRCIRDACFAWFNSGYMFYERLLANFTYFLRVCAQLMLRVAVFLRAVRTWDLDIISTSSSCDGVGLTHFASFFALLRVGPGVERQFFEPSMVKSSSPSRAPLAN